MESKGPFDQNFMCPKRGTCLQQSPATGNRETLDRGRQLVR